MRGVPAEGTLRKLPLSPRRGKPVFDDLRRCSGAEWKRGPVERFTGWRWNGAEWNRLELAKSGPKTSRCVVESCFRRLIGVQGSGGRSIRSWLNPLGPSVGGVPKALMSSSGMSELSLRADFSHA
jgi:hypothetical protein